MQWKGKIIGGLIGAIVGAGPIGAAIGLVLGHAYDRSSEEEDEAALSELEEFVRVAVLLLHGDCVLGPRHRRRLN